MKISAGDLKKLFIISSVCFVVVWFTYVYNPVSEEINSYKTKIPGLEFRILELKKTNEQLLAQKLEEIINKEKSKELENYLVNNNSEVLGIMNEIMVIAKKHDLAVVATNAGKKRAYMNYEINNFLNITAQSRFENLADFFKEVYGLKNMIQCSEISLRKLSGGDLIEAKISFICYNAVR